MNNKGISVFEVLILMIAMGVVFIGLTIKFSYAFVSNTDELYENEIKIILNRAETYGLNNVDLFTNKKSIIISVKELLDAGYLLPGEDDYTDPRDNTKTLNDVKITLEYEDEEIKAKLA